MILAPVVILGIVGMALLLRPWPFFVKTDESESYRERSVAVEFVLWVEKQASARGLKVRGVARPISLECKKCGKSSNYFVYPDEVCERCWRATLEPVANRAKEQLPQI
ncbi:MAG TPA: hypothetical protein VGI34_10125 [Candidatus Acidoferrales bacterium]|jgi:hypothetical protein